MARPTAPPPMMACVKSACFKVDDENDRVEDASWRVICRENMERKECKTVSQWVLELRLLHASVIGQMQGYT